MVSLMTGQFWLEEKRILRLNISSRKLSFIYMTVFLSQREVCYNGTIYAIGDTWLDYVCATCATFCSGIVSNKPLLAET